MEPDPRHAGQTAFLPGGWLHAQLALADGVAVTGRWLQKGALGPQLAAWQIAVSWACVCDSRHFIKLLHVDCCVPTHNIMPHDSSWLQMLLGHWVKTEVS